MDNIVRLQQQLSEARLLFWKEEVFLSWQWILLLLVTVLATLAWLRLVVCGKLRPILICGALTLIFSLLADTIGGELLLWDYPRMLIPWGPRNTAIDWMIALFFMLMYQHFPKWRAYLSASLALAVLFSFVLEPLVKAMGIYQEYDWKSWYSFPIYFSMACAIKAATDRLDRISAKTKRKASLR